MSRNHRQSIIDSVAAFYEKARAQGIEPPRPASKKRRETPEHDEQRAVVAWLRMRKHVVIAPLNGSRLSGSQQDRARQWGKLVSLGASAGVTDLITMRKMTAVGCVLAVAIEMKAPSGGRASPEQLAWHERLRAIGCRVIVAHGAAAAINELEALGFGAP